VSRKLLLLAAKSPLITAIARWLDQSLWNAERVCAAPCLLFKQCAVASQPNCCPTRCVLAGKTRTRRMACSKSTSPRRTAFRRRNRYEEFVICLTWLTHRGLVRVRLSTPFLLTQSAHIACSLFAEMGDRAVAAALQQGQGHDRIERRIDHAAVIHSTVFWRSIPGPSLPSSRLRSYRADSCWVLLFKSGGRGTTARCRSKPSASRHAMIPFCRSVVA
jgi:hypothetical protein